MMGVVGASASEVARAASPASHQCRIGLIHWSAWKGNPRKFAGTEFSEVRSTFIRVMDR